MSLAPGVRLGPYEIVAPIGAGGMGEVYRARDTRLSRDVAIKVLPASVATDLDQRRRLDREAKAISSLSHPNICALFDVGHEQGIDFLVMELLEGETLAARLTRGALPLEQALRYAAETADALAAAHRSGIVHRDLKPGNVMITRTGVRLLDFGLAKPALEGTMAPVDATMTGPITARGTVVGTFHYMSPEQLDGYDLDARSDIFALGSVIYEMVTGTRAFEGQTTASTIAAILEREPAPIGTVQPLTPPVLDDIVRGCLAKNREDRWQTAHDVKLQIDAVRRRLSSPASGLDRAPEVPRRSGWASLLPWVVAAAVAAISYAAFAGTRGRDEAPETPGIRASLLPPPGHTFTPNDFAVSPDGRRVAFVATGADGAAMLWVASLETAQAVKIGGTDSASAPFWSPDSRWIAFFTRGRLLKVEPGGAGVQAICDVPLRGRLGTWTTGDVILFSQVVIGPLLKVSASGGTPVPVTEIPAGLPGETHRYPQFLADGQRFLYVASWTTPQRSGLYLGALDGRPAQLVSAEITSRAVLSGPDLFYVRDGVLLVQTFDATSGKLTGTARPVVRNEVVADWRFGEVPISVSPRGILVFQSRLDYNTQLVSYDRDGRELGTVGERGYTAPELSPEGRRLVVTHDARATGQTGLWLHDLQRNIASPIESPGNHTAHSWFPDGRSIAYSVQREKYGIYRRAVDGSDKEQRLFESDAHVLVTDVSSDGKRILFMDFAKGVPTVSELDLDTGQVNARPLGAEAVYSPDGQWIAFVGAADGSVNIERRGVGNRIKVSPAGGAQVRWRDDMRELFYMAPDKTLMSVPLTYRDGVLEPAAPVPLIKTRILAPTFVLHQYAVSGDGQRFLINSLPRNDAAAPLTILTNWPR